jgi:hypothetical protein
MTIIDLLPSKEGHDLKNLRSNTLQIFNDTDDPKRRVKAEELLDAIEKDNSGEERDNSDVEELTEEQKAMWRILNPDFECTEIIEQFRKFANGKN